MAPQLCHCGNCKRFTGGPFGITTKIPRSAFAYTRGSGGEGTGDGEEGTQGGKKGGGFEGEKVITVHEADNGSGVILRREFCGRCGGGVLEYGVSLVCPVY